MVPEQWYAIYRSTRLTTKPIGLTRLGQKIVLWRDASGRAVCMPDRCCHRAAQLSRGRVREGCLECPYHGMRYDGDGCVVKVPALGARPVPAVLHLGPLPCREERGLIWLWHGKPRAASDTAALPPIPWDDALDAELAPSPHAVDFEDPFDPRLDKHQPVVGKSFADPAFRGGSERSAAEQPFPAGHAELRLNHPPRPFIRAG